jgi:hypothetical protein
LTSAPDLFGWLPSAQRECAIKHTLFAKSGQNAATFIAFTLVFGGFECVFGRKYAQKSTMMNITLVPANGFEQAKEAVVGGRISSRD